MKPSLSIAPSTVEQDDPPLTLTKTDLARHLRISERQVDYLTESGDLPPPFLVGKSRRWSRRSIVAHIKRKEKATSNG